MNPPERIKKLMFTFDDLARLSSPAVQSLLRAVERDKLPLALKGASEGLRDLFFETCPNARPRCCATTSKQLGPVKLRDVDEAQGQHRCACEGAGGAGPDRNRRR